VELFAGRKRQNLPFWILPEVYYGQKGAVLPLAQPLLSSLKATSVMNSSLIELERDTSGAPTTTMIHLPLGLLGFEQIKDYSLTFDPEEAPFGWLQAPEEPVLAFLVLSPFCVMPNYELELSNEDTSFLHLTSPADSLVLSIVTLQTAGGATMNLRGPIVVNRRTLIAKQVVPANAAKYALRHPLQTSH
jgi:flagellar assembly factor FliW